MLPDIVPVILCGGAGRRLRPLSTSARPKPFLKLGRRYSMLQETVLRVQSCAPPVLVLNHRLEKRAVAALKDIDIVPQKIILEPVGRNTAPALAAAAEMLKNSLMLILPSDHAIRNPQNLMQAVKLAAPLAKGGSIVSFGIKPRRAEPGFGYIRRGAVVAEGIFQIDSFIEKPPRNVAKALLRGGTCVWNSGIFLLSAETARAELKRFAPSLFSIVEGAVQNADRQGSFIRLSDSFAEAPALSIDVALMERSDKTLVVPVDLDWSDLGTWPALLRFIFR
jgi:mannose-1-phosphate guanylyltransferase/mannose-6-phosphate isomerase